MKLVVILSWACVHCKHRPPCAWRGSAVSHKLLCQGVKHPCLDQCRNCNTARPQAGFSVRQNRVCGVKSSLAMSRALGDTK